MRQFMDFRKADHDIDSIYLKRWSPRSFADQTVPDNVLNSLFEAARWAPSVANIQPWRFVYAKTKEDKTSFLSFINESNVKWCQYAPVLIAVSSQTTLPKKEASNPTHAFDTGTAWGFLALEAVRQGLRAHAMGGFNRQKAKEVLKLPENFDVHAIVAVGYQGQIDKLDESLQEREKPSNRKKIEDFIHEGAFLED